MRLDPHYTEEALRRFERRFQEIAEVLREQAKTDPRLAGMGTTMTLACSAGSDLIVAHVGIRERCAKGDCSASPLIKRWRSFWPTRE